ncbi:DnaD domain protein [Ligilactobacillus ruminis]|uniref:DnaD domain protein n=1 Tax=Ligilactobacillus ruminis TaxID=1623 RepID=UPI0034A2B150
MAYFRVNKSKNYTVMSNHHLRDKNLSLRAIGLLSKMLSLPDNWDYSIKGLVAICKDKEPTVRGALSELKEQGYVVVTKLMPGTTSSGRIEYVYDIYESPRNQTGEKQGVGKQGLEKQGVEFQGLEFLDLVKRAQLNTKEVSTKELNTERVNTEDAVVDTNLVNIVDQPEEESIDDDGFGKIVEFYQENFGMMSSFLCDDMRQTYNEWQQQSKEPDLIIIKAMQIALSNNVRNWKYACAVLRTWEDKRPQSLSDVEALEAEHKNNRAAKSKHAKPEKQKTMENFDDLANKQNAGIDMSETLSDIEALKNQLYG